MKSIPQLITFYMSCPYNEKQTSISGHDLPAFILPRSNTEI